MTFKANLVPALATLLLPFASLAPASAQTIILPPVPSGAPTTTTEIVTRGHRHLATKHKATKNFATKRSSNFVWRGPLHTKKVADMPMNETLVWVNTPTGVYHFPGSPAYGKTDVGKYMTEPDAIKLHYRAAYNNQ